MEAGFAEAKAAEVAAIKIYHKLIDEKLQHVANLGVGLAQIKNKLGDTEEALMEDKALADTIKILNDDDALEFTQCESQVSADAMRVWALATIRHARQLSQQTDIG